jgi:hypothetical protein
VIYYAAAGILLAIVVAFLSLLGCINTVIIIEAITTTNTSHPQHASSTPKRIHPASSSEINPSSYTRPASIPVDTVAQEGLEVGLDQPVFVDVWAGGWVEQLGCRCEWSGWGFSCSGSRLILGLFCFCFHLNFDFDHNLDLAHDHDCHPNPQL